MERFEHRICRVAYTRPTLQPQPQPQPQPQIARRRRLSEKPDVEDALAAYLVQSARRATIYNHGPFGAPVSLAEALERCAAHQRDPLGEGACAFLAEEARRNSWRFIDGAGFIAADTPWRCAGEE